MMHFLSGHDAAKDYILAGTLTSSPLWAPWLADVNGWLTFIGLALGVILGARRLWRDLKEPAPKSPE